MTTKPSNPCESTDIHEKVLEQFKKLVCDDGLLVQTVGYVKESNSLSKRNVLHLRVLSYLLAFCVVVLIGVVGALWMLLHDTKEHLTATLAKLEVIAQSVQVTKDKIDDVQVSADEIKQTQDSQPKVELVPESDPVKAKDAPIKVRITPPKDTKSSNPPAPTVEVPLPMQEPEKK